MTNNKQEVLRCLIDAGIEYDDAVSLRRISLTLHRWHELECGDGNEHGSWSITRGNKLHDVNGKANFHHDDNGKPYLEYHPHIGTMVSYSPMADRERGAMKRLKAIMAKYPGMGYYVQGDPRGCALYIIRPGDVPDGANVDSCYSNGVAVYK